MRESLVQISDQIELDSATLNSMQTADKVESIEQEILTLTDLQQYADQPDYEARIDAFIAGADPRTISDIFNDNGANEDIKTRIGLHYLKQELVDLEEIKGEPYYKEELDTVLANYSPEIRDALSNEPDLSEEVVAALYEPFSDSLDTPEHIAVEQEPQEKERVATTITPNPQTGATLTMG